MTNTTNNQENNNIREQVKNRPLNRRKLLRRMVITASMAVIFGVLACFTFLVLEPVFTNLLYPEDEPEIIQIAEDPDEILPEDMILTGESENTDTTPAEAQEVVQDALLEEGDDTEAEKTPLDTMLDISKDVGMVVEEMEKSIVTITSVNTDEYLWGDEYESRNHSYGVIVATTTKELLILSHESQIANSQSISVAFVNGVAAEGSIKQTDGNTNLCVIAVAKADVPDTLMDRIEIAKLGNSAVSKLTTTPILAIGKLYNKGYAVSQGYITSGDDSISLCDDTYRVLNTDIYGSRKSSGIIINMSGEVLGIISDIYVNNEAPNMISAIGISDLKKTIERMSNGKQKAILGIEGADVTRVIHESTGTPYGAYVKSIIMNSPAMSNGVLRGDIIVGADDNSIENMTKLSDYLAKCNPGDTAHLQILRQTQGEYKEMSINIVLSAE